MEQYMIGVSEEDVKILTLEETTPFAGAITNNLDVVK